MVKEKKSEHNLGYHFGIFPEVFISVPYSWSCNYGMDIILSPEFFHWTFYPKHFSTLPHPVCVCECMLDIEVVLTFLLEKGML